MGLKRRLRQRWTYLTRPLLEVFTVVTSLIPTKRNTGGMRDRYRQRRELSATITGGGSFRRRHHV